MKASRMLCEKPFDFGHASGVCNLPREHDWVAREPNSTREGCRMGDATFRAFLDLLMVSDPWPLQDEASKELLDNFADAESRARGYDWWFVAYHEFKPQEADGYALTVRGSGFTPESVVTIDDEAVSDNRVAFVSSHELRVYVRDEATGKAVVRLAVDGARVPLGGKS